MDTSFVWDHHFVTDLVIVDEQHHALVDLFNELSQHLFSQRVDREVILADTYERLVAYTEHHFKDEEDLMRNCGVDEHHIQSHRSMHRQFVEQVAELWAQRSIMQDTASTLAGFLTSWLGLHILGVDQSMARQIQSIQDGMTAQEAYDREAVQHDNSTQALLKMIGKLYAALSAQNTQLAQANQLLEQRVAERTQALEEANARLRVHARTDGVLGIANRAYFNERLEQAWAIARRGARPLSLVLLDVDYFKRYNDCYGHLQGDACLQSVARALQRCVQRETDLIARYGGEEIAVIPPETETEGVIQLAQRMVQAVEALQLRHEASLVSPVITVSAGVAGGVPPASGWSARAWVHRADEALYCAKAKGRNRVVCAAPVTRVPKLC